MPKGPTLIDLTPKLGDDRRSIISSARDRYGNLAVSIFDNQERYALHVRLVFIS